MTNSNQKPQNFLLPLDMVTVSPALERSVRQRGILVPAIGCGQLIIDGHQRIKAALQAGQNHVPVVDIQGEPGLLFAELNQHRALQPFEIVSVFSKVPDRKKGEFCLACNLSTSPQMLRLLDFLAVEYQNFEPQKFNGIPMNIWREIAHLKNFGLIKWFVELEGTVSEKRMTASLLRQSDRKNSLPEVIEAKSAREAIDFLNSLVQPRRTAALTKFQNCISEIDIPSGISFKIDQTFDRPGMDFQLHVTRNSVKRFEQAAVIAEKIFAKVEEL